MWINIDIFNFIKKIESREVQQTLFPHSIYYVGVTKNPDNRTVRHITEALKNGKHPKIFLKNECINFMIKEEKNFLVVSIRGNMCEDDAHIREGMIIRTLSVHNLLNSTTGRCRPAAFTLDDQQILVSSMLWHAYERLMSEDKRYVKQYGYSN